MYKKIKIKNERLGSVTHLHPWIFSGAIASLGSGSAAPEHGEIVFVTNEAGNIIGTGTYSKVSSIAVRVMDFKEAIINEAWFVERFKNAESLRLEMGCGENKDTTGYRIIFGETDLVPGLVVDKYENVLVVQISTAGLVALKKEIVAALVKVFAPAAIVERSDMHVRGEERLEDETGILHGKLSEGNLVEFKENGFIFFADVVEGQKTGFYLDQKNLRLAAAKYAKGREVLNVFSYSGAQGVYAIKNGAKKVHLVDSSNEALELATKNAALNKITKSKITTECMDAFDWFSPDKTDLYDMVIIDPPALIKNNRNVEQGKKAYHFLNRAALRVIKNGGIFVTSSCSHFLSDEDFNFLLRRASVQSGARLITLEKVTQSQDHPSSIYFPESQYLKSYIFRVEK